MSKPDPNPFDALEKIFHEPNRLAIMSALCVAEKGLTFNALREQCSLTDGNLNRHLKVLEEAEAIRVTKAFVKNKPRTTIFLSKNGLKRFGEYLAALQQVLATAQQGLQEEPRPQTSELPKGALLV
ncbi:MAG: transcriptional regulator [Kiritimatiellia bacterium]|nr:transcriptional regulator [Lentisphaerota bacterium]